MIDQDDAVHAKTHSKPSRGAVVKAARDIYLYHQRTGLMHYTQSPARMSIVRHKWRPPFNCHMLYEDCSSFVTACYWLAGLPDPNGLGYNGQGYTGTLCQHGKVVKTPKPGDLVFYGNGKPWHHVALVTSDVSKVYSHGSEGGPRIETIRYRKDLGEIRSYF